MPHLPIEPTASRSTTAAQAGDSARGSLNPHDLRLLGLMAEAGRLTPEAFLDRIACAIPGVRVYADLGPAEFTVIADGLVGNGFRHPGLPLLSRAQRAALLRARRRLGLPGPVARRLFREVAGTASTRHMDGVGFLALLHVLNRCGAAEPLPDPAYMTRWRAMAMRRKAWLAGVDEAGLNALKLRFGGTFATRGLDERAYVRVMVALGPVTPEPPPPVEGEPGMVTQAQANVIWRLWLEARRGQDATSGALDVEVGRVLVFRGLDTLTRAGARVLINRLSTTPTLSVELGRVQFRDLSGSAQLRSLH